ncbi:hypothetical protein N5J77_24165 [Sphingobium yanoikuyae]|uniref:Dialkylrecorsinol condensing enzyme n=1 Tax=Sphingobium yanoikuyae TaxID=13690 RepID=A0AA43BCD5_SPHYA|nr:hypothetical protein [Sphingobium yanoikuyae]MDH2134233.1 hypothetical protein [Sphingobium yanoikuyae]MDH2151208.1 hypothetical protein [Sphingobium yanoikuyae]MDH2170401.1 hypothetical protein [Sphingobium yanoikuyae]
MKMNDNSYSRRKRVLAIYFSNSGDTKHALDRFLSPIENFGHDIVCREIVCEKKFPYPWKGYDFFNVLPETISGIAPELSNHTELCAEDFDMIVLAWQVWFLSPSLPMQAFMNSTSPESFRDRRVISIISCRQMWYAAYIDVARSIARTGAIFGDNLIVRHRGKLASFVTTPYALLTGKDRKLAFLERGGQRPDDLVNLEEAGRRVAYSSDQWGRRSSVTLLDDLVSRGDSISGLVTERLGRGFMRIWASVAITIGGPSSKARAPVMYAFTYLFLILIPIMLVVGAIIGLFSKVFGQNWSFRRLRGLDSRVSDYYPNFEDKLSSDKIA